MTNWYKYIQFNSLSDATSYQKVKKNIEVVKGYGTKMVTVLLGNGDGSLKPKVTYPGCPVFNASTKNKAVQIQLADFNRDGHIDIALGCTDGNTGDVGIMLGNGDGSFKSH